MWAPADCTACTYGGYTTAMKSCHWFTLAVTALETLSYKKYKPEKSLENLGVLEGQG